MTLLEVLELVEAVVRLVAWIVIVWFLYRNLKLHRNLKDAFEREDRYGVRNLKERP